MVTRAFWRTRWDRAVPSFYTRGDFFGTPARTAPSCFFLSPRWIYGFTGDLRLGVGSSGWFPSIRGAVVAGVDGHLSPGLCVAGLQNCAGSVGEVRLV